MSQQINLEDFRTWAELKRLYSQVEWIIPQWMPKGYVTMLAADPGVGKSLLALTVCKMIVDGERFFNDFQLPKYGVSRMPRVLWVEAESGEPFHMQRAAAINLSPLQIIEPRRTNEPTVTPSLNNEADKETIRLLMQHEDVVFIVIDSLSAATSGTDENSAAAGQTVQWLSEQARNTNKPVLVIHHMNKNSMRARGTNPPVLADIRGTTALTQHARVIWTLDNPSENEPSYLRLACAKSNLSTRPAPIYLTIQSDGRITPRNKIEVSDPVNVWWQQ